MASTPLGLSSRREESARAKLSRWLSGLTTGPEGPALQRRAELLLIVTTAGREMAMVGGDNVLIRTGQAATDLGFDFVRAYSDPAGIPKLVWSFGDAGPHAEHEPGLVGLVGQRGTAVILGEGGLAVPVWQGDDLVAAIVAGRQSGFAGSLEEFECLELLCAQAGAALVSAAHSSDRDSYERRLTHQAFHDSLTGLPNRALFLDRLAHAESSRIRTGSNLAVLFCDLDRFNKVNESLGQKAGDEVLQAVARRLRDSLGDGHTLARFGADEFTVLMEGAGPPDAALTLASRILAAFSAPFRTSHGEVYISASVGVSSSREPEAGDLLRQADLAMYRAKEQGGGRCEAFQAGMSERARLRMETETGLRRAIDRGEFAIRYQPVVRLRTGKIVGMEALVRWEHPERGTIPPDEFIPLAEETGLIVRIGSFVFEEVCTQLTAWRKETGIWPALSVGVNLSALEFHRQGLRERLMSCLERHGLPGEALSIEVTESVVMSDDPEVRHTLEWIRALGVRLAIDDFGLGYSSLNYLKRFPFDVLKVDRSFVDGVDAHPADRAIVRSVLALAQDLGMRVIAEGVETKAQLDCLRLLGCELAQGYYLYPPATPEQVAKWLTAQAATDGPSLHTAGQRQE